MSLCRYVASVNQAYQVIAGAHCCSEVPLLVRDKVKEVDGFFLEQEMLIWAKE